MGYSGARIMCLCLLLAQVSTRPADEPVGQDAIMAAVRDGGDIELAPLFFLLRRAADGQLDGVPDGAVRGAVYEDFAGDAERLRGEVFEIAGRLMQWAPLEVDGLPGDLAGAVKGELVTDRREVYTVVLAEPPADGITVRVRGRFLKIWTYEDRRGQLHNVPVIVAARAWPEQARAGAPTGMVIVGWAAAAVILLVIAAVTWFWLRELARPRRRTHPADMEAEGAHDSR